MPSQPSRSIRPTLALSQRRQLTLLGVFGGGAFVVILALMAFGRLSAHAAAPAAPAPAGVFQATPEQWRGFEVRPVAVMSFPIQQDTDGKIATDDDRTTPVVSPYSGRVTRVFVEAGALVSRGQPLFAVEGAEYVQAQSDLGAAQATQQSAAAQVRAAQAEEARLGELYKADGASLKEWQQSQAALAAAQASLRSAELAASAVQNRLRSFGESDRQIGALKAAAGARKIQPEAVVTAPIGGTVVSRQVEPGQYLTTGSSSPAFQISDLSRVWLVANVREADVGKVRLGQTMSVRVLAWPGRVFQARVTYIGPAVDPVTRRLAVRAEIANPDGLLKPEMFADCDIETGPAATSLAVPEDAVIYEGQSAHVWLARSGHTLGLQPVRLGPSSGGLVAVLEGLQPGDRIATSGALFIDRAVRAG